MGSTSSGWLGSRPAVQWTVSWDRNYFTVTCEKESGYQFTGGSWDLQFYVNGSYIGAETVFAHTNTTAYTSDSQTIWDYFPPDYSCTLTIKAVSSTYSSSGIGQWQTSFTPVYNTYTVRYSTSKGTAPGNTTYSEQTGYCYLATMSSVTQTTATNYFTITANANGGTLGSTTSFTCTRTQTTTYPFQGWSVYSSATQANYAGGDRFMAGNCTLYAVWGSGSSTYSYSTPVGNLSNPSRSSTSVSRTVTINANGGSSTVTSRTSSATVSYSFTGWYTATSGGSKVTTSSQFNANTTIYAQWSSSTGSYGAVTLPTTSQCTRTGYTLLGFATSSGATSAAYSPGASYTPSGNVTLYAVWQGNSYTVTYNANGGSVSPASKSVTYGGTYGTLATPTWSGHSFTGWRYNNTAITSSTSIQTAANHTIVAQWDSLYNFSLSFNGNGNTSGTVPSNQTSNNQTSNSHTFTFTKPTLAKSGYDWAGWATSATATSAISGGTSLTSYTITNTGAAGSTASATLYAVWIPKGLVRVHNGSQFKSCLAYVHNGSQFKQVMPYVNIGSGWRICS